MKQDAHFSFDGSDYSVGIIDAREQFHLFRRLAPIVAVMGMEMFRLLSGKTDAASMSKHDWIVLTAPLIGEMAKMPQDDVDYVIQRSLRVVRRKEGDAWAPMLNAQGGLMFADLGMVAMLRLIIEVLRHNLGDFFPTPPGETSS